MPTPTYTPLATVTLGSTASSVTFSSIPATYRDLIVVCEFVPSGSFFDTGLRFNADGGTNYSFVEASGSGSGSGNSNSAPRSQAIFLYTEATNRWAVIAQIMDYSATDKHKTVLSRATAGAEITIMTANRWANTAAITSVQVRPDASTFASGSTFSLYGVIA
jgi:hypothetical protein